MTSIVDVDAGFEPELPWDSPKFREKKDTAWIAGCRWLQSWWREQCEIQPGERTDISETLVGAMFPVGTEAENNFFGPNVIAALEDRVINGEEHGVVATEVLFRSLLETQVLTFNLLGEFVGRPNALLPWVRRFDATATEVTEVRIEWKGFDGFVVYRSRLRGAQRFLALEIGYAEDRSKNKTAARPKIVAATNASAEWHDGAPRRLDRPDLRSLWFVTLGAQALVEAGEFDAGRVLVLGCVADIALRVGANFAQAELTDPDRWLGVATLDGLVATLAATEPEWAAWIRRRYLDFTPVLGLLAEDDPRCGRDPAALPSADLRRLVEVGQRVAGGDAEFDTLLKRLDAGDLDAAQVAALEARAAYLAADLETFWGALRLL